MTDGINWGQVARYLDDLYTASDGLEQIFPGRKFTLDGHLVGSIGEVVAAYIFDLDLNPASTLGHDARSQDGRNVEIKLTQGRGGGDPARARTSDRAPPPQRRPDADRLQRPRRSGLGCRRDDAEQWSEANLAHTAGTRRHGTAG